MASGEEKLRRTQIDQVAPSDTLLVSATDPVSDKVDVSEGYVVLSDQITAYGYGGGTSFAFTPVVGVGMTIRWDLLCLDLSGATPILKGPADDASLTGSESPVMVDWWNSIPSIPLGYMPLAAVRITETANPVLISDGDIVDIRAFFGTTTPPSNYVTYSPGTPTDWIVAPSNMSGASDELADRLTAGAVPQELNWGAGSAGTSKYAALADHVHRHGLLESTGAAYWAHIADSIGQRASVPSDWDSGLLEDSVCDRLDELAARMNRREQWIVQTAYATVQAFRQDSGWTWTHLESLVSGATNVISIPNILLNGETIRKMRIRCDTTSSSGVINNHDRTYLNELVVVPRSGAPTYNSRWYYVWRDADSGSGANDTSGGDEGGYSLVGLASTYNTIGFIQGAGVAWDVNWRWNNGGSLTFDLQFDDTPDPWSGSGRKAGFLIEIETERLLPLP